MSKEVWLTIEGWPNYLVSNHGRVRSLPGGRRRGKAGRCLKPGYNRRGYVKVSLTDCTKRTTYLVHRLVAAAFIGPANGLEVNHINGIKADNRPENLEYCTRQENIDHAIRLGRFSGRTYKGTKVHCAKLTEDAVRDIRSSSDTIVSLSNRFGVSKRAIRSVRNRETWAHVV